MFILLAAAGSASRRFRLYILYYLHCGNSFTLNKPSKFPSTMSKLDKLARKRAAARSAAKKAKAAADAAAAADATAAAAAAIAALTPPLMLLLMLLPQPSSPPHLLVMG